MGANWAVNELLTPVNLLGVTDVADATPVASADFDVRAYPPGSRFLLVLTATETNEANTGGTWSVQESATDGGSYTAATVDGSLAAVPAEAGTVVRYVSVLPNRDKPFVQAVFTGADASAEVAICAMLLVVPRVV